MVGFYIHKSICLIKTSDRPEIIRPENRFSLFLLSKNDFEKANRENMQWSGQFYFCVEMFDCGKVILSIVSCSGKVVS